MIHAADFRLAFNKFNDTKRRTMLLVPLRAP